MKILFAILILTSLILAGCSSSGSGYSKEQLDSLANCLSEKGIKEYGAFWCPNCARQQKMFGDSYDILKTKGVYVECDPRCVKDSKGDVQVACRGVEGQPELCIEKGIDKYPTWEYTDGTIESGVQELSYVAQKAGCSI